MLRRILPAVVASLAFACNHRAAPPGTTSPSVPPEPSAALPSTTTARPAESSAPRPPPAQEPAVVQRLRVPGDRVASLVAPTSGEGPRIVFLPGICSNAYAYLLSFPEAARKHGGAVAIEGDALCGAVDSGFRSLSPDPERQHARISAALAAAGTTTIPREGITLVGYSLGATIAESLARRYPDRYARVVVIGEPRDPAAANYRETRAVVTMSCSLDVSPRMKQGASAIARVGVPALFLEMPGCTHGNINEGERIFDEAFSWLHDHARPPRTTATQEPLTGLLAL